MRDDLGDKYEGQDDSEYRFSDEDVQFDEVEPTPPKAPGPSGPKETLLARLSQSRRMIISGVVFIVLVFIVYKMVAPTSNVPSTNIAAAPLASQQNIAPTPPAPTPPAPTQAQATPNPVQAAPVPPPAPVAVPQAVPTAPVEAQQAAQQVAQTVANMPSMIPVQSPPSTYNLNQPTNLAPMNTALTPTVNAATSSMSTITDRSVAQFQAEYAQRLNEYATQNRILQDQLNTLNSRVAGIESQLHQLVQALTQQAPPHVERTMHAAPPPSSVPHSQGIDSRLAYSVQAIIPGRAWLRSDNGETVTVAEGDVIKDLGRVVKIDPYDGVVEVNTGTKTLSLSYGNGG